MTKFKVGDRVRLTGGEWGRDETPPEGTEGVVSQIDPTGVPLVRLDNESWFIAEGGWEVELVTSADEVPPRHIGLDYGLEKLDAIDPDHYKFPGGTEVIDITRHLGFLEGNVVKYVTRAGRKGDRLEDLKKAAQYLQWAIEDATNAGM